MGEIIYPGLYFTDIDNPQTEDDVRREVINVLTAAGKLNAISSQGLQIVMHIVNTYDKDLMHNAVVKGINLPYDELRILFRNHPLGRCPMNLEDVDFGIQRLNTGLLKAPFDELLHKRLKEGQGIIGFPIKCLTPDFIDKVLGGPESSVFQRELHIRGKKHQFNLNYCNHLPGYVNYRNLMKKVGDKKIPIGFILKFTSRLAAAQGLVYLNGNRNFALTGRRFETGHNRMRITPGTGLRHDGELLDAEVLKAGKFVPLNEVLANVLNMVKILTHWNSTCLYCNKPYKILGVNGDITWLAAKCKCSAPDTYYNWPNEDYYRLTVERDGDSTASNLDEENANQIQDLENPTNNDDNDVHKVQPQHHPPPLRRQPNKQKKFTRSPLMLLTQGLRPQATSVSNFDDTAIATEKSNFVLEKKILASKFQVGTIHSDVEFIEDVTVDKRGNSTKKKLVNIQFTTRATKLWCPDGSRGIQKIKLLETRHVTVKNPILSYLEDKYTESINGQLQKISILDTNTSIVEMTVLVDPFFPSDNLGKKFYMIPRPPTSYMDSVKRAVTRWRRYVNDRPKATPLANVRVIQAKPAKDENADESAKQEEPYYSNLPDAKTPWIVELSMERNHVTDTFMECCKEKSSSLSRVHFGTTLYVKNRSSSSCSISITASSKANSSSPFRMDAKTSQETVNNERQEHHDSFSCYGFIQHVEINKDYVSQKQIKLLAHVLVPSTVKIDSNNSVVQIATWIGYFSDNDVLPEGVNKKELIFIESKDINSKGDHHVGVNYLSEHPVARTEAEDSWEEEISKLFFCTVIYGSGTDQKTRYLIPCSIDSAKNDIRDFFLDASIPRVVHDQGNGCSSLPAQWQHEEKELERRFQNFMAAHHQKYLNPPQIQAIIDFFTHKIQICLGPPGCGKTYMLCHGVLGLLRICRDLDGLIVITTPTNLAADVVTERLHSVIKQLKYPVQVRRMLSSNREAALKIQEDGSNGYKYLHTEIDTLANKRCDDKMRKLIAEYKNLQNGRRLMKKSDETEVIKYLAHIRSLVIRKTSIIVCTVGAAVDGYLERFLKSHPSKKLLAVVVDESNAVPMGAMLPLFSLNPEKIWLVGDFRQLSSVMKNKTAMLACGDISTMEMFSITDFVRNNAPISMLTMQYRFHDDNCKIFSKWTYDEKLTTAPATFNRMRFDPEFYRQFPDLESLHMLRINYQDPVSYEKEDANSSFSNSKECEIVLDILQKCANSWVDMKTIIILAMYVGQVNLIKSLIKEDYPEVKVCTSDSFEGKESSIVIVSMVRDNPEFKIGFLRNQTRTNVALTRVREYLFYISSEKTFIGSQIPGMEKLYEIISEFGVHAVDSLKLKTG